MGAKTKYYIVAAAALPEIFIKVAEAKRMMQTGEADTVGEATRQVGISRSAFYKYKDAVQPFNDMKTGHIITFYAMLKDNPGVLSNVLAIFAGSGANILTINQSIPTNGCAAVTVSAETSDMEITLEELISQAAALEGVVDSREYYGLYIKYYIRAAGQIIKVIEKNDGVNIYEAGQSVRVVMDPRDVMAYPAT